MQKITPFLWFNGQAEEAMKFYSSIFADSRIESIARYGDEAPGMGGKVLTGVFTLAGQRFMALDGGPQYAFTEAVSFYIGCETQAEIDDLWQKLSQGSSDQGRCGWIKDRFGLSWQIVPPILGELLQDPDGEKAGRVMQAMLKMTKIDIEGLRRAHEGK